MHFKPYFLGSKEIIKNKLDEIGNVRNAVAHFRPIKKEDVDLIKQNSLHTLSHIEKTLKDFISCHDIVPTNTEDGWYKNIIGLRSNECHFNFIQSKNEEWIKLTLNFTPPILRASKYANWASIASFNLKTNNLLTHFPELLKYSICVTEVSPTEYSKEPENYRVDKKIRFTISRKTLNENYLLIQKEFEICILQITDEVSLIKQDNLARGKLVEVVRFGMEKSANSEYCQLANNPFLNDIDEDSPVEFWGSLNYASDDFITNTDKFPWMPISISDDKEALPF